MKNSFYFIGNYSNIYKKPSKLSEVTSQIICGEKFTKLSIEESNKLLESLSKDVITEEEMALSDIYNIDVDIYKTIKQKGKIGF